MKTLTTLFAVALFSSQAFALSNDFKFVAIDETSATNVCLVAAEQGLEAAQKVAKKAGNYNLYDLQATSCNGVNIKRFARKYKQKGADVTALESTKVIYQFKALDNTQATQVCAIAAQQGIKQARKFAGLEAEYITCNGKSLLSFARKYKNS